MSKGNKNSIRGEAGNDTLVIASGAGTGNKLYGNVVVDTIKIQGGNSNYLYGGGYYRHDYADFRQAHVPGLGSEPAVAVAGVLDGEDERGIGGGHYTDLLFDVVRRKESDRFKATAKVLFLVFVGQ